MGSSGYFSADVRIKFSLKQEKENSVEEIEEFLKDNQLKVSTSLDITEENIRKHFEEGLSLFTDDESWTSKGEYASSLEDILETFENIDEDNEYKYELVIYKGITKEDLKFINLSLLKEYKIKELSLSNPTHSQSILSCRNSIYYENDNSTGDSCEVSKYQKLLSLPKATLVLDADGSTY